jgi:hypothetical protein
MVRTRVLIVSGVAVACLMRAANESAAAAVKNGPEGPLLMSSRSIERQVDGVITRRVKRNLANLKPAPAANVISPEELEDSLGRENAQHQLELEIEVRAPPGLREQPVQAQIPFGLAGLAWGVRHPGQAWRLLLPVLA